MKTIGTICLAALATLATAARAQESVDWVVTVTAQEETITNQWQEFAVTVPLSGAGGAKNYVPPAGTSRIDITVSFPGATVCELCGESFTGIPNTYSYYSVWYTFMGGTTHRVQVFGGNVGGALLRESTFDRYCPNGYRQMAVLFDALVGVSSLQPRSASASGNLMGGAGDVLSAPWIAAPAPMSGGTLKSFSSSVSGNNPKVALTLALNADQVSGDVIAKFPSCIPSPEICDGVDNDCDGVVDEGQGTASCGVGACANTVPACVDGKLNSCAPLPAGTETCDGVDNNCDGAVDENLGTASCGAGACANTVAACVGGQAQTCSPLAAGAEVCGDGIDNDCDGVMDNGCSSTLLSILERFADRVLPPGIQKLLDKANAKNASSAPAAASAAMSADSKAAKAHGGRDDDKKAGLDARHDQKMAEQDQKKAGLDARHDEKKAK